jgi:adenosylcobinamide-phosphate synthase
MREELILIVAVIIDLIIGDPNFYPHPVIIIGKIINYLEKNFRKLVTTKRGERIAGLILVILIISLTYITSKAIIYYSYRVNYYLGLMVNIWLLSTTIAIKGLVQAGFAVYQGLLAGNLELARKQLGWIVGRDTNNLAEGEVVRGTIETLAENTSDGIIAPIFYGMLGGFPLAMTYKAVNTLDSMLGYKNQRYRYFGWAAARLDDLANWIPARITACLYILIALIKGKDWKNAIRIILRDARKHPSPNAGYPEAAIAGSLNIRLGGVNYYQGEESFRAYLGDARKEFDQEQIQETISLMYWNVGMFLVIYYLIQIFY